MPPTVQHATHVRSATRGSCSVPVAGEHNAVARLALRHTLHGLVHLRGGAERGGATRSGWGRLTAFVQSATKAIAWLAAVRAAVRLLLCQGAPTRVIRTVLLRVTGCAT